MPPGGAGVRAEQLATLERLAHEALTSDEIGRLLDELAPHEDSLEYDSYEASLIRLVRRDWEKARRVPVGAARRDVPRRRRSRCRSGSRRGRSHDFARSCPRCARTSTCAAATSSASTRLRRAVRRPPRRLRAGHEDGRGARGLRPAEGAAGAARRRRPRRRRARPRAARHVPARAARRTFELEVIERFGFDASAWRLDPAVHPFARGDGHQRHPAHDPLLRATTSTACSRRCTSSATGSTSTGRRASSSGRRSARGASLGLHESQSRMWENLVGRTLPFWRHFFPQLQASCSRTRSRATTLDDWYREVNCGRSRR